MTTSEILMIRPANFAFNLQTAASNTFMAPESQHTHVHTKALREFDNLVSLLEKNGVEVLLVEDSPEPHTPDAIFPNNWFSTHPDGSLYLYPMEARNRRMERSKDALALLRNSFEISRIIDLTYFESQGQFLEGTGSMVIDRDNALVYACLSSRTHRAPLLEFCSQSSCIAIPFHAYDQNDRPVYHTNVLMCIGDRFAVVCSESISHPAERAAVTEALQSTDKQIIAISYQQLNHFAGNMIQLNSKRGDSLIVMSEQAFKALTSRQIAELEKFGKLLFAPLYTIETAGGGSARCMIAEIFLRRK